MSERYLSQAKYTAPSGNEFTFFWEQLQKTTNLKTDVFTIPNRDGVIVQHQGSGPVTFPMVCIFNGNKHIKTADAFEAALLERDIAELQHPIYGIRKVMPTGNIERSEDFIGGLNETQVKITFTEVITDDKTRPAAVAVDKLKKSFNDFMEAAAADFADGITADNISEQLSVQFVLGNLLNILQENLSGKIDNKKTTADYVTSMNELKNNIKTMFDKTDSPAVKLLNIAWLILNIMKLSSRLHVDLNEKIKNYTQLITQITKQFSTYPFGVNNIKNYFTSTRLFLAGAVASIATGSALSIASNASMTDAPSSSTSGENLCDGIVSREKAVAAAFQLNALLTEIQTFEDGKIEDGKVEDEKQKG